MMEVIHNKPIEYFGMMVQPNEYTILHCGEFCDDPWNLAVDLDTVYYRLSSKEAEKHYKDLIAYYSNDNEKIWPNGDGIVAFGLYHLEGGETLLVCIDHDGGVFADEPFEGAGIPAPINAAFLCHASKPKAEDDESGFFKDLIHLFKGWE